MSASVERSAYTKDNPLHTRLVENRVLSRPGSAKEIRHLVFDLAGSELNYKAGDSLGVFPRNRPADVGEILERLGATGLEPVVLPRTSESLPFGEALLDKLSLADVTRKFVELLFARAAHPAEQERLMTLLAPENHGQLATFLEEREFVDMLAEFPSARVTPQEITDHMRRLVPRLYSIASSPRVHPEEIHLTVAVVRYETNRRSRVGVCSTFMPDRVKVGETPVQVFVADSHFGPPKDGATDCIMVGPGTGIAPFRAFMQDRVASGATGRNWLFFGEQKEAVDFLYGEEWRDYQAKGRLARLDLAWSRDQEHKVYVQDRMRENAAELWRWLQGGAYFYVCGDAKRMAKDVDAALHEIIAQQGGMDTAAAAAYVKQLKKDRRYQRDVY